MRQFSATHAKQSFGELLRAAATAPVAIERHGAVQAIVASPELFAAQSRDSREDLAAARRLARFQQAMIEKDRLIRHHRIAIDLLIRSRAAQSAMIQRATAVVNRWRQERLCSTDYIDRWSDILRRPAREIATVIVSDMDGWGSALRQNSPWVGLHV